jgi:2-oxoisovalerate dehydrogenase E1 component
MRYFSADGTDLAGCYDAALAAADYVRAKRAPAFLHLSVVRLMAHAGNAVCASCHTRSDPMGLSLEAFDTIGGYRPTESGETIGAYAASKRALLQLTQAMAAELRPAGVTVNAVLP